MELKFSHVDVLVKNLEEACEYYAQILKARISKTLVWDEVVCTCATRLR